MAAKKKTAKKSSGSSPAVATDTDENISIAPRELKQFIERVERLEEERTALTADIREVYAEAKGHGFDPKIMRQVVRLRKIEKSDRQHQEAILELYLEALGEL